MTRSWTSIHARAGPGPHSTGEVPCARVDFVVAALDDGRLAALAGDFVDPSRDLDRVLLDGTNALGFRVDGMPLTKGEMHLYRNTETRNAVRAGVTWIVAAIRESPRSWRDTRVTQEDTKP